MIALRAPASVDPKKAPPARLVMLKWGDNPTVKGNFRVTKKTLESLAANQKRAGFDEVVLDFEHNTVPNHPANRGEPAFIAARGNPTVIEGEGLVFENLTWTEPGKEYLENYHDLSPVVARDKDDNVVFVHSGALCRNGATYNLHAFNAELDLKTFALTTFGDPAAAPAVPANVSASQIDVDLLRRVLNLSTLSADASIEDINRALSELDQQPDARASDQGANALSAVRKVSIELATLSATIKNLKDTQIASERNQIRTDAIRDGKIIPKEIFENLSVSNNDLRSIVDDLPEIVPLDQRTPENIESLSHVKVLRGPDEEVRQKMGISKDAWQKHNAA